MSKDEFGEVVYNIRCGNPYKPTLIKQFEKDGEFLQVFIEDINGYNSCGRFDYVLIIRVSDKCIYNIIWGTIDLLRNYEDIMTLLSKQ